MSAFSDAVIALSPSSYWRFEGASPLADSGSGAITLTDVGTCLRAPSLVPCESSAADNAYDLNGSSMYLTGGNNYSFATDIDFTIALWFKPESASFGSGFQMLLAKRDTTGDLPGWLMYGSGTDPWDITFDFDMGVSSVGTTFPNANISQNTAYFLVFTWVDSTQTATLYVNGSSVGSDNTWSPVPGAASTTGNLTIGAQTSAANKFNGVIDDVAIWSGTALSAGNVTTLWNASAATSSASYFQLLGIG